jgi:hypothetical protein
MPAKKVVPKPDPVKEVGTDGAETKRKERGTLAKLRAERAAAAKKEADGEAPTRVSPPKKAAAAAPWSEKKPKPAGAQAKATADGDFEGPTKVTPKKSAASSSKSKRPTRSGARSGRAKNQDEESSGSGRRGRAKPEKKKSPMLMIVIILVVLGGGGFGAWKFFGDTGTEPNENPEVADAPNTDEMADSTTGAEDLVNGDDVVPDEDVPQDAITGDDPEDDAKTEEADPDADAKEEAPAKKPEAEKVLAEIASLPPCNRARGTTDEEWEQITGWVEDLADPDSGAAGPRAGKKLVNMGRKAMPAIINAMLTMDYSTEPGMTHGDLVQRTLKQISNGNSFNWGYADRPNGEWLCRGSVEQWHKWWKLIEGDIEYFIKLAKLEKDSDTTPPAVLAARRAEAEELRELYGN